MAAWNSGLFDCCDSCSICCYGSFCLPCLVGENAQKIRGKEGLSTGCCFLWGFVLPGGYACVGRGVRRDMRDKFHLPAEPCTDCCTYCFCASCAACQESRELQARTIKDAPILVHTKAPPINSM